MKRRTFLRGAAGAAVLTGAEAVEKVNTSAIGTNLSCSMNETPAGSIGGPRVFKDFTKLLVDQEEIWKRQAKRVDALDADLLSMHLPLVTLVRWQRERNFKRIKEEQEFSFTRSLRTNPNGVEIWL